MVGKIKNITLYSFSRIFFKKYYLIFCLPCLTLIPFIILLKKELIMFTLDFSLVLYLGLITPFILHEYMYILFMKKEYSNCEMKIEFSLLKISLLPKIPQISRKTLLKIALLPLIILFSIGIVFFVISYIMNYFPLRIVGFLFMIHIINAIPPFGDGLMIIKALLSSNERR
ncbi:hypothetical protein AST00_06545 [Staphylococcus equorum]|nr:hypothetical protein AST00_06545 [Staphylococcus equorum]OEK68575.1 hypothetical protein AST02_08025 [Staphylococcus equorum]